MKRASTLIATLLLALTLAGCGGEEQGNVEEQAPAEEDATEAAGTEEASTEGAASDEVAVGGYVIEGPNGGISIPEIDVEREDVESYVRDVRPIVENSVRDLSRFMDPSASLENETLTLNVEAGSLEEARTAAQDGQEALRSLTPPEDLEPVHDLLLASYAQGIAAYGKIIQAFESGDAETLASAVRDNLPEIEQFTTETRAIVQELERTGAAPDDRGESQR